ncbi:MAG: cobalamin adenosyltransferase [Firmicutes bacterium]|jgi:ethanolamine utilization cobalamin adenosyltransferase|nr:cobalamin adenosyltransferase [Bacillota bacterium]NBI63000.1 cobalamin adenosyltransferase [Clostridiales bacterium]
MKFITEEDLRDLYKKQPFTDYDLPQGQRLTPGARQFLVDRGIKMYADEPFGKPAPKKADTEKTEKTPSDSRKKKKFRSRMKSLQVLFLLSSEELLKRDICMAQQLTGLYKQFAALRTAESGTCDAPELCCDPCSGINGENFSQSLDSCFEITEFHMQMEKGREMLLLARLRSQLEELELDLPDFLEDEELRQQVAGKLNQIMNTLSQMICGALGGKTCQRSI